MSNTDMTIGSNRDIYTDRKKLPVAKSDVPKAVILAVQQHPSNNLHMLTEKHNDEKLDIILLIVGTGLITYHFR